jgi:hypothetical protein
MKKNKSTSSRQNNSAQAKALRTGAIIPPIYAHGTKDTLRKAFDLLREIKPSQRGTGRKEGRNVALRQSTRVIFAQWLDLFKQRPGEPNE